MDIAPGRSYGDAVTTPPDPQREGQQPDQGDRDGQGAYDPAGQYPDQDVRGARSVPGQEYPPYGDQAAAAPPQGGPPDPGQGQYGAPAPPYDQGQYGQPPYGQPQYGPGQYGRPPYGQPQYGPGQYGEPQYGQPQYGQRYPGSPYPYNPYGAGQEPAGLDGGAEPAPRPGIMHLALVLLTLSTLPFLLSAMVLLLAPAATFLTPDVVDAVADVDPTFDPAGLLPLVRIFGGLLLGLALLYVLLAVLAHRGANVARITLTVLTVLFDLLLLLAAAGGFAVDPVSALILLVVVAMSVAGVVLMYLPRSSRFFATPRR